jgi:two-component system chemotaxis response regulator CheY
MKEFPKLNTKEPDGIAPNGKPYTVMIVESKEFQRKLLAQIFESEQYKVVETAANGKEALEKYDKLKGKIDLITTELDMPVLDGYAMLYELNQRKSNSLVVFISEETTKGVMQDLIQMGIKDYILKPINRKVVLERVNRVIAKYKKTALE